MQQLETVKLEDAVDKTQEKLSWQEIGEIVWEIGGESVQKWETTLNEIAENYCDRIEKALDDLEIVYGTPRPHNPVIIDLYHNPIPNNIKGGPISNLAPVADKHPEILDMGDIIFRMPTFEARLANSMGLSSIKTVLHEIQHSQFQTPEFTEYFDDVVQNNPKIQEIIENLKRAGLTFRHYANEPMELLTTYLENLTKIDPQQKTEEKLTQEPILKFRTDKQRHVDLLRIEADLASQSGNGPQQYLNKWAEIIGQKLGTELRTVPTSSSEDSKIDVYKLSRRLSPDLAYEYLQNRRKVDEEFILRLFQLAESEVLS